MENLTEGRSAGESRELDFTPWGGAYNRVPVEATAFAHRDELFLIQHTVIVDPDVPTAEREAARHWLERSWMSVRLWGSGVYPNSPIRTLRAGRAYHGTNYDRLVRVKERYDRNEFFRFEQSLPAHVLGGNASV